MSSPAQKTLYLSQTGHDVLTSKAPCGKLLESVHRVACIAMQYDLRQHFFFCRTATNGSVSQTGNSSYARNFCFLSFGFHIQVQRNTHNTANMCAMQAGAATSPAQQQKHYFAAKNNIKLNNVGFDRSERFLLHISDDKISHHFLITMLSMSSPYQNTCVGPEAMEECPKLRKFPVSCVLLHCFNVILPP